MTRLLIQYLVPLLLPTAIYMLWLWYSGRRAARTGDTPPSFTRGGFFWTILSGAILLFMSLAFLALTGGVAPDAGVYEAPRLENGKITAPQYIPAD